MAKLSRAQSELLRRFTEGLHLFTWAGYSWQTGCTRRVHAGVFRALYKRKFVSGKACHKWNTPSVEWTITPAGRAALEEYDNQRPSRGSV